MRISMTVDYAVRACVELAAAEPARMTTDEVAAAQGIPRKYLLSVLATMRRHDLLVSRRGVEGGFHLARPAGQITVADVIRAVDGPLANVGGELVENVDYPGVAAPLRDTWVALRASMRAVLEHVTIQDLLDARLPRVVTDLTSSPEAWQTRREGLRET